MTDNFTISDLVVAEAKDFFKGRKLGFIVSLCKDHDGAYRVYLIDSNITTREVCIDPNRNYIVKATK